MEDLIDYQIRRITDHVSSEAGNETIVLSLKNDVYYGLDSVGTEIWRLLEQPRTVSEICAYLEHDYAVTTEECIRAVVPFLLDLYKHKLVELLPLAR
jgi:hypothetical protein